MKEANIGNFTKTATTYKAIPINTYNNNTNNLYLLSY